MPATAIRGILAVIPRLDTRGASPVEIQLSSCPRFYLLDEVLRNHRRQSPRCRLSLVWVSAVAREGRTIWVVDAHRDDGKRYVVHADEKLTAFLELERAVCIHLLTEQI